MKKSKRQKAHPAAPYFHGILRKALDFIRRNFAKKGKKISNPKRGIDEDFDQMEELPLKEDEDVDRCHFCHETYTENLPMFHCHYCLHRFCINHRLPEKHNCTGRPINPHRHFTEKYTASGKIWASGK